MSEDFRLTFVGGDADAHVIDMQLLGRSLIGYERILTEAIVVLSSKRLPHRKERAPLRLVAEQPQRGSWTIPAELANAVGQLPLIWDFLTKGDGKTLWQFTSFVLKMRGGRKAAAQPHLDAMLEQLRITEAARDRSEQRWHDSMREWLRLIDRSVERLAPAARNLVAPIGPSVSKLWIGPVSEMGTPVDLPMADAIRDGGDLSVGDQERLIVSVDGYQHHNKTLKIERLDGEGFMSASVTDPAFELSPNIYTEAAGSKLKLLVEAKRTYRGAKLERLHISNAIEIVR